MTILSNRDAAMQELEHALNMTREYDDYWQREQAALTRALIYAVLAVVDAIENLELEGSVSYEDE